MRALRSALLMAALLPMLAASGANANDTIRNAWGNAIVVNNKTNDLTLLDFSLMDSEVLVDMLDNSTTALGYPASTTDNMESIMVDKMLLQHYSLGAHDVPDDYNNDKSDINFNILNNTSCSTGSTS